MRIIFITGSYPPDTCGVGDYTYRLAQALQACGVTIDIVSQEKWSVENSLNIVRRLNGYRADIVHIQYPTVGYGFGLAPQAVSLLYGCVVTLHEVSQTHILRRLALYPFTVRSKHVIFTSSHEQHYALQWAPWLKNRSSIIPIGSNIVGANVEEKGGGNEIVYFGLIRPNKGLEDVVQLASLIKDNCKPFSIRIIGKPHPDSMEYYNRLRLRTKTLPVLWCVGSTDDETTDLLSHAKIAYVPYPDGVSERRGSLLALLANGNAVITTRGAQTPPALGDVVSFVQSPREALALAEKIFTDEELRKQYLAKGRAYAANFEWSRIASRHVEIYNSLIPLNNSQRSLHMNK